MVPEIWISIIVGGIITLAIGLILGRYRNKTLIAELKKQNNEQKEMLEKSFKAIGDLKKPKKPQAIEELIKELATYGAKEWGKKKIDELLYPDE